MSQTKSLPAVTAKNYFDPEIEQAYMGASQFKRFMSCEAAALATVRGEFRAAPTGAMLVGSYVDAYFSGEMETFRQEHPEIFKRDGSLKADYARADDIIDRMEGDEPYMLLMSGRKQVVRTGEIAGVPFKIKIDCLLDEAACREIVRRFPEMAEAMGPCAGAIVDQKVMRDLADVWSDKWHSYVPFVEAWGYDYQGAIYQAVEGHMLPFLLAVGTKEDPPDLLRVWLRDDALKEKLYEVEDAAPRFQAIKEGREQPRRCEQCAYCRATRRLSRAVSYPWDIDPE